jgi:hypothetical protein
MSDNLGSMIERAILVSLAQPMSELAPEHRATVRAHARKHFGKAIKDGKGFKGARAAAAQAAKEKTAELTQESAGHFGHAFPKMLRGRGYKQTGDPSNVVTRTFERKGGHVLKLHRTGNWVHTNGKTEESRAGRGETDLLGHMAVVHGTEEIKVPPIRYTGG